MRNRLQKAIDNTLRRPEFIHGGTILCPEGHTIVGFHGGQEEFEAEKANLIRKGLLSRWACACQNINPDDLQVRWWSGPKVPTQVTVDIADLQELLRPTARIAKTTLCCDHSHENSPVHWNEFNGVVQCHACGAVYEPLHP